MYTSQTHDHHDGHSGDHTTPLTDSPAAAEPSRSPAPLMNKNEKHSHAHGDVNSNTHGHTTLVHSAFQFEKEYEQYIRWKYGKENRLDNNEETQNLSSTSESTSSTSHTAAQSSVNSTNQFYNGHHSGAQNNHLFAPSHALSKDNNNNNNNHSKSKKGENDNFFSWWKGKLSSLWSNSNDGDDGDVLAAALRRNPEIVFYNDDDKGEKNEKRKKDKRQHNNDDEEDRDTYASSASTSEEEEDGDGDEEEASGLTKAEEKRALKETRVLPEGQTPQTNISNNRNDRSELNSYDSQISEWERPWQPVVLHTRSSKKSTSKSSTHHMNNDNDYCSTVIDPVNLAIQHKKERDIRGGVIEQIKKTPTLSSTNYNEEKKHKQDGVLQQLELSLYSLNAALAPSSAASTEKDTATHALPLSHNHPPSRVSSLFLNDTDFPRFTAPLHHDNHGEKNNMQSGSQFGIREELEDLYTAALQRANHKNINTSNNKSHSNNNKSSDPFTEQQAKKWMREHAMLLMRSQEKYNRDSVNTSIHTHTTSHSEDHNRDVSHPTSLLVPPTKNENANDKSDSDVNAIYQQALNTYCVQKIQHVLNQKYNSTAGAALRAEEEYLRRMIMKKIKLREEKGMAAKDNNSSHTLSKNKSNSLLYHLENDIAISISDFPIHNLHDEDKRVVADLKSGHHPAHKSAHTTPNKSLINVNNLYHLQQQDVESLILPKNWLNDAIINAYLELLCSASARRRQYWIDYYKKHNHNNNNNHNNKNASTPHSPRALRDCDLSVITFLNSHFYVKVKTELEKKRSEMLFDDHNNKYNGDHNIDTFVNRNINPLYHNNKHFPVLSDSQTAFRWIKKQKELLLYPFRSHETFLDAPAQGALPYSPCRAVLIPLHVSESHWTLAVLNKEEVIHDRTKNNNENENGNAASGHAVNLGTWFYIDSLNSSSQRQGESPSGAQRRKILEDLNFIFCESYKRMILNDCGGSNGTSATATTTYNYVFNYKVAEPFYPPTVNYFSDLRQSDFNHNQSVFKSVEHMYTCKALMEKKRTREQSCDINDNYNNNNSRNTRSWKQNKTEKEIKELQLQIESCFKSNASDRPKSDKTMDSLQTEYFQTSLAKCPQQQNGYDCGVLVCEAAHQIYFHNYNFNYHFYNNNNSNNNNSYFMRVVLLLEVYTGKVLQRLPGNSAPSCIATLIKQ